MDERANYFTAIEYGRCVKQIGISTQEASQLGRKAANHCRELGVTPSKVPDPRFGHVNIYPKEILDWAWRSLADEGDWNPDRRLQDKCAEEYESEACKALDEAAGDLSEWAGNSDLEDLGISTAWCCEDWPDISTELEPALEQVEEKLLMLRGDLEILESFKKTLKKAAEATGGTGSILIDLMWKRKYGHDE